MNPVRKRRLMLILLLLIGVGAAAAMALMALSKNINLFYSPTQVLAGEAPHNHPFRLGGLVEVGSVQRADDSLKVRFRLTDTAKSVEVEYDGILPDLFREGQGIVATGKLQEGNLFVASEVLAKHDENYMPPEVAEAIDKAQFSGQMPHGVKQGGGQ